MRYPNPIDNYQVKRRFIFTTKCNRLPLFGATVAKELTNHVNRSLREYTGTLWCFNCCDELGRGRLTCCIAADFG
jgi:hypothetical protein